MGTLVFALLIIVDALVAFLVAVLLIEVIAATASSGPDLAGSDCASDNVWPRMAVLVPAHNESCGLLPTLEDIKPQLRPCDRVLVIADNCTDDTAAIAAAWGAEVIERRDAAKRGKGYALDFGLRHLDSDPPGIVVFVDADSRLEGDVLSVLMKNCVATRRPTQALYLMKAPHEASTNSRIAELAWRVKNWMRPLGLKALGLPCQLVGTGMAFPWEVIRSVDLASGSLVEDLKLGLDLASSGHAPVFCPSARVVSEFPQSAAATRTQRERWEGGHLGLILTTSPRLLLKALAKRNWDMLSLALDLAVPPLSLLGLLVLGIFVATLSSALIGFSWWPAIGSVATLTAFALAASLAWFKVGRDVVPVRALLSLALYSLGKLDLYRVILLNKANAEWIRTERTKY
jgi:cellulose synthase/poly-beta-1,6-N-acetylglucosamine synthase-like glycosyltransferase